MTPESLDQVYVFITPEFPPFFGGGISKYSAALVEQLDNQFEVLVLVPNRSGKTSISKIGKRSRVISVGLEGSENSSLTGWLQFSWEIKKIVEKIPTGGIAALENIDYGGLAYFTLKYLLLQNSRKFPIITTSCNPSFNVGLYDARNTYALDEYVLGCAEKFCLHAADVLIAPSLNAKENLIKFIGSDVDVRIVNPPIPNDIPLQRNIVKAKSIDVLFFGRLQTLKGYKTFLLSINSILSELDTEISVGFLGESHVIFPEQITSEAYAKKILGKNFSKVTFYGKVKDVYAYLEKAKVIVMPSLSDFAPNAVIESLAMGAKIVVSGETGAMEIAGLFDDVSDMVFTSKAGDWLSLKEGILLAMDFLVAPDYSPNWQEYRDFNLDERLEISRMEVNRSSKYPNLIYPFKNFESRNGILNKDMTLVIPHFNQTVYLEMLLRNLHLQNAQFPVVVVDDGSKPSEISQVEALGRRYSFTLIKQENMGLSHARNSGMKFSQTEYVAFLDSDDFIDIKFYDQALCYLENFDNVAAVGSWIECFQDSSSQFVCWDANSVLSIYKNTINSSSLIWKKSILLDLGGFDETMKFGFEDFDCVMRTLKDGYCIPIVDGFFFKYRVRKDSMFQLMTDSLKNQLYSQMVKKYFGKDSEIQIDLFNLILSNGNPNLKSSIFQGNSFQSGGHLAWNRARSIYWRYSFIRNVWWVLPPKIQSKILKFLFG